MKNTYHTKLMLLFTFFLLASCGGSSGGGKGDSGGGSGGGNGAEDNSQIPDVVENYKEALDYHYNEDDSATQELLPFYVNKYEEVQNKLDSLNNDQEAFDNYYEWYIGDLISTQRSIDGHPSYAPRGDGKSLIVTVNNGVIDYSDYPLIGDLDDNGTVDFDDEDLLKDAIYQPNNVDVKYDLNGDGSIDISDMIDLMARLGTEIKTFDFYTPAGEKLNIPSRDFSDPRSFSYTGTEETVMVVAKDINKVSGFTEGLSDIKDLWYIEDSKSNISSFDSDLGDSNPLVNVDNTTNKKLEKSATTDSKITAFEAESLEATSPERIAFVREALDYIKQTPDPYLLGWKISVKFRTTDNAYLDLDSTGMLDMDGDVFFGGLESDIELHFSKTTMGKETKRLLEKNRYLYHIGAGRYEKDEEVDGKYNFDLIADSFVTHVKAFRKTIKTSKTINGKTIFFSNTAHALSVVFTSEDDKTLSGFIKEEGKLTEDEGTIKATRIGPDPEETSKEGDLNHAEYTLADIPFGAYKLVYTSGCGCDQIIDNEFIFSENREYVDEDFNINKKDATVQLTILNKN